MLAHELLSKGYKVVGCAYDNDKERAEHRLNNKDENTDIKRAEVALQRALNRLSFNK